MENQYQFRQFSLTVWMVSLALFFAGLLLFVTSEGIYRLFSNTTQQTLTLIFILSAAFFLVMAINIRCSKVISVMTAPDSLEFTTVQTGKKTVIANDEVVNYSFNTTKKGLLDILRVNVNGKNRYFWLGALSLTGRNERDALHKEKLHEGLQETMASKRKKTGMDAFILFAATRLPYIVIAVIFLSLLGFLAYFIIGLQ
ncbi:hypothetical protein [Chryseobacterium sp. MFBS3-17]|uniref:hypothetical protein n=1 Tax=Chryseobacterium sp. MFBS3-17 TaxID=2886689 RepID=UPI001D0E1961|nr:hypothetical protein [Chryseobacterium sp. MFBS3-17]MCC2590656.1 hypothetical protein [Chryseobacterium sp. MFBS3-17]